MTAAYLHRRTPSRALGSKTPWELLHSHIRKKNGDAEPVGPPPIHHLRRFGCLVHKRIPEEQRTDKKLGDRSKHAMMVGYVHNSTSMWRIWDPDFKKTIQTSDVDFDEEINCYTTCPPPAVSESDGKAIDPFGLPEKEPIHVEYVEAADPDALSGTLFSIFFALQTSACSQFRSPAPAVPATCSLAVQFKPPPARSQFRLPPARSQFRPPATGQFTPSACFCQEPYFPHSQCGRQRNVLLFGFGSWDNRHNYLTGAGLDWNVPQSTECVRTTGLSDFVLCLGRGLLIARIISPLVACWFASLLASGFRMSFSCLSCSS
jgi:hypothetical protein